MRELRWVRAGTAAWAEGSCRVPQARGPQVMEAGKVGSVEVIVPTYGRPLLLDRCLQALLRQRLVPRRIWVVVRDGDGESAAVVLRTAEAYPWVRLVPVGAPGVVAAMRAGVAASSAPMLAFTDDDAEPAPEWLSGLVDLISTPGVGGAGGRDLIPGQEGPVTPLVGLFSSWGRLSGNHHLGWGHVRDVDVLKGVNMAFRADALALPAPGVLRGGGAEVHFEMLMCLWAKQQGWRLLYNPSITVLHDGAPRLDADQRTRQPAGAVFNAAFNYVVAVCGSKRMGWRRILLNALLVGTRSEPSLGRAAAALLSGEKDILRRLAPAVGGKVMGVATSLRGTTTCLTAGQLRSVPVEGSGGLGLAVAPRVGRYSDQVTACIPTLQRIDEVIATVGGLLGGTIVPGRILVSEAGGSQYRAELATRLAAICLPESVSLEVLGDPPCGNRSGNRNWLAAHVATPYCLFVDDDIDLDAGFLEDALARLGSEAEIVVANSTVSSGSGWLTPRGHYRPCRSRDPIAVGFQASCWVSAVFRDLWLDESIVYGYEDADISLRLHERYGRVVCQSRFPFVDRGLRLVGPSERVARGRQADRARCYVAIRRYARRRQIIGFVVGEAGCNLARRRRPLPRGQVPGQWWSVLVFMLGGPRPAWTAGPNRPAHHPGSAWQLSAPGGRSVGAGRSWDGG